MKQIGILAGTFDPVHAGHLAFAELAADAFRLDKVVFLPEREPRNKKGVTKSEQRLDMLKLAVDNRERFEAFDTGEKMFKLRSTMPKLRVKYPGSQFLIMLGSDVAAHLAEWEGIDELEDDISFLVAVRGINENVINGFSKFELAERLLFVHSPNQGSSSSLVRAGKIRTGIAEVDKYIAEHRLYV